MGKCFREAFLDSPITKEHLDGMKFIVQTLGKKCQNLHLMIKEKETEYNRNMFASSWDAEDIRNAKEKLSCYVEMRVLAEKTMRKCRHISEEQKQDP